MEIPMITDGVVVATTQGLGFAKCLLRPSNTHTVLSEISSFSGAGILSISAGTLPVDTVASPPIRSDTYRAAPRALARKTRRTKRRSLTGDSEDGGVDGFFGDDGPFGGSGGGGGGWNFDRFGGENWEEESSSSDPAFDFVYEVLCWIALSNCMHFAFKKVVGDGISDPSRDKVPMRLVSMCCCGISCSGGDFFYPNLGYML